MSYEPDPHVVQMKVLRHLLMHPQANFAVLRREADMQSDQFTFHLKKLIKVGYIEKQDDGTYHLTHKGKEYANRMDTAENVIEKQPKLSVVLMIEREDGLWLHQQRLKHPYYGYWGHPTGKVRWGETLIQAAARELREETGLAATLRLVAFIHKLDYANGSNELLEDKLLCLVHGTNPRGELIANPEGHHNQWMTLEDYEQIDKKFSSVAQGVELTRRHDQVILEQTYHYAPDDY